MSIEDLKKRYFKIDVNLHSEINSAIAHNFRVLTATQLIDNQLQSKCSKCMRPRSSLPFCSNHTNIRLVYHKLHSRYHQELIRIYTSNDQLKLLGLYRFQKRFLYSMQEHCILLNRRTLRIFRANVPNLH